MTRYMFIFVLIVQSHNSAPIFSFMAFHQIYNKSIMTGDISRTETVYPSWAPEFITRFITKVSRLVISVEQKLFILPEHMNLSPDL